MLVMGDQVVGQWVSGAVGPKWALLEGTRYQVKVCGDHESNPIGQSGAVGTKSGPLGPSEDL